MIRTAILAFVLVAVPSAALAQSQLVVPDVRIMSLPAADNGPPADYISNMAPEYNGWVYQETFPTALGSEPILLELYSGAGYPATIMVCANQRVDLYFQGGRLMGVANDRCTSVTTDRLRISTALGPGRPAVKFRWRILAVHRAAE